MVPRWLILLSTLSSLLLLGFTGWHAWEWHHGNAQMLSRRLQSINRVFTPSLAEAAQNEDMAQVHELLTRLTRDPAILNATLRDESGNARDSTGEMPPPAGLETLPPILHTGHHDGVQRWVQPLEEFAGSRSTHRYWLDLSLDPQRASPLSGDRADWWTPLVALLLASPAMLAWRQSRRGEEIGRQREPVEPELETRTDTDTDTEKDSETERDSESSRAPPTSLPQALPDADLSYVSHELRAPLSGVLGFCRLLENSPLDVQQREWLRHIHLASNGLLDTVDHVLGDTRRCRADNVFDITEVLWEVLCLQTPLAQSRGITLLAIVYDDVPPRLVGADVGIRQLLTNLINNAIKYGGEGDVVVRVVLESREGSAVRLRLSVSDGGSLDPAHGRRLEQAIHHGPVRPSDAEAGVGVGICHRLVANMNGTLALAARSGKGHTLVANIGLEACAPYVRPAEFDLEGAEIALWQPHSRLAYLLDYALKRWRARPISLTEADFLSAPIDTSQLAIIGIDIEDLEPEARESWQSRFDAMERPCLVVANVAPSQPLNWSLPRGSVLLRLPISRYILGRTLAKMLAERRQRMLPPRPRILVVDDDEVSQHYLDALLPIFGVDVVIAGTAAEAYAVAKEETLDLVLMDLRLPDAGGVEATRRLRGLSRAWEHKPIIAMTAEPAAYEHHVEDSGSAEGRETVEDENCPEDENGLENENSSVDEKRLGDKNGLPHDGFNERLIKPLDERLLRDLLGRYLPLAAPPSVGATIPPPQRGLAATATTAGSRPSSHPDDLPVVDKAEGRRLSGNRAALAEEMLTMLVASLPAYRRQLQDAWQRHDVEQLVEIAHQLGGGCRYCGVPQLSASCDVLENRARRQPLDDCGEAFRDLMAACDRLIVWADDQKITANR
ncbi:Hpt domain-containing protein [Salinicola halophyticus]|uniref:Hpt domain-containing protein n=1 Tax=Salinicola halophyticus TaxID=1808881 RepID=UPI000DA246B7|nr:Hpt domain-containing protein [Salinicola halophyticus]